MYPYDLNINLADIQIKLAKHVIKEDIKQNLENIAGVDVSFSKNNRAVAAAVLVNRNTLKITEKVTREVDLLFPYISGFLGFRESDAMISVLNDIKSDFDCVMVNGHGIMHPRSFGLASQVGLILDKATIGVAKRLIVGSHIKRDKSSTQSIIFQGNVLGTFINGNYISIGHKISLKTASKLVSETSIFKTPEPIRQAHILATETFKNSLKKNSGSDKKN